MQLHGVAQIGPGAAATARQQGALLLDVREEDEWQAARIPGATWLPLSQMEMRWQEVPLQRSLVCYCATGVRSHHAARFLRECGAAEVANLVGGIKAWHACGQPVTIGPPE